MDSKGAELSLSVVILIVVGLIVLVLLIFMVSKASGGADKTAFACQERGGDCEPGGSCPEGTIHYAVGDSSCGRNIICCMDPDAVFRLGGGTQ